MAQSKIRPSTYEPVNFDMKLLDYMTQAEQEQALAYFEALTKIEAKDHLRVFAGRNGYTPAKHHQLLIDHLEALERREIQNLLVITPPGAAKALALDTPIPTPTGWRTMGSLSVGDQVFADDGKPCQVTWVGPIHKNRPVYAVTTDCGDEIIADEDHEWLVRLDGKPRKPPKNPNHFNVRSDRDDPMSKFKIKETWELCRRRAKRPMIQRAKPLELPEVHLPIDPYLLGLWLGNGDSAYPNITAHHDDEAWQRSELERRGYVTRGRTVPGRFIVAGVRKIFRNAALLYDPKKGMFGRKHIPSVYLRASYKQRLELLQGLVDSDGHITPRGETQFTNTNHELALQTRELVRSLGVKAGWSEGRATLYGKDCGATYAVRFYMEGSARIPRKAERTRNGTRTPNTYIDVTPAGFADAVCIEVNSPTHMFLCGRSMTPTHNSTYSSILFPAWYLGRNPKHMVLAASNTMELAERFGRKVRGLVAAADFGEIFNGVGLSEESAAAARWETTLGGEMFAVGTGGSIVGRRGDILVLDDVVRSKEDVESEQLRNKVWDWYVADVLTRLKPNAVKLFVNTRWHEDDLAGRILEREADKWTVLHMEMENTREDDPLGRAIGERLWPEWFTQEMVDEAKQDVGTWNALYQGRPSPDGGGEFKKDWVEYYDNPPDRKRVTTLMLVDPANSKTKKSDYTAIWVLGVGGDDNFYVLDMVRDRLDLSERIELVFRLHRKWKPVETRYERFGLQTEIDYLKIEMDRRSYRFRIREVAGVKISKEDRIRRLIPYFKAGRIVFPREFNFTDHTGKPRDLVQYFLNDEYASFPVGKHDDMIDSLSRLAEPGLVLPKHVTEEEKKEMFMLAETEFVPLDPVLGY